MMSELDDLQCRYLEWIYDQTCGSITQEPNGHAFIDEEGLDDRSGYDLSAICAELGLVNKAHMTHDDPCGLPLTAKGVAWVRQRRQRRADQVLRAQVCRRGLLRWLSTLSGPTCPTVDDFASHSTANIEGDPFTIDEVRTAGTYLKDLGLAYPLGDSLGGDETLKITGEGVNCMEDFDGDVVLWRRRQANGGVGTTLDFRQSTFNAPVTTPGRDIGTVNQIVDNGLDIDAVVDWMASLEAVLPSARLRPDQLAEIEATIVEFKAQLAAPQPNPGLIRQSATALLAKLPEAVATAALSKTPVVLNHIIDIGRQLLS